MITPVFILFFFNVVILYNIMLYVFFSERSVRASAVLLCRCSRIYWLPNCPLVSVYVLAAYTDW